MSGVNTGWQAIDWFAPQQGEPKVVFEKLTTLAEIIQLPINLHWYVWNDAPNFDRNYPFYFPAKEGFAEVVEELQTSYNVRVFPTSTDVCST